MEFLTRSLEGLKRLWASLTPAQRAVLVSAVGGALLLVAYTSSAAASGSWERVAGTEVDDAARGQILERLKAARQRHEVRGKDIYVPKEDADRVVLELAGENVVSDRAIWKFLENSDIFADRALTEKRYQVALQRKLEYMIRKIDAIRNASVQITPPTTTQTFGFGGMKAGASVQVELQPGRELSTANIRAIAGLVAHAVPGLDRDRVLITDNRGIPFSVPKEDAGGMSLDGIRDIEQRLERDIKNKITELFPNARVVVRAVAKTTSEERREQKFDPRGPVIREEERRAFGTPQDPGAAPRKGVESLEPSAPPRREMREEERKTEYKVGETQRVTQDPRGAIERLTVGVLLPVPVDAQGRPTGPRPFTQDQAESLVMQAAGVKDRSDVSVVFVETRAPEPILPPAPLESVGEWFAANWGKLGAGLAAAGVLAVVLLLLRAGLSRVEVEEIAARPAPSPAPEAPEGERLREAVRDIVRQDPAEAAASLRSWVRS